MDDRDLVLIGYGELLSFALRRFFKVFILFQGILKASTLPKISKKNQFIKYLKIRAKK